MKMKIINSDKRKPYFYLIAYGLCFISLGLAGVSLGPLLPSLSQTTGTSLANISFIFSVRSLGYLLGSASGGHFYERINGHKLMAFSLSLMAICHFLIPLFPNYILVLVLMFMIGLGHAAIDIGGNVNLLWIYKSKVGPFMNTMHFSFGIGALFSPMIINYVMHVSDGELTGPFWLLAAAFCPGLISLLILEAPRNTEKDQVSSTSVKTNPWLIILLASLFFIYVGIEGGFGGWIYSYVTVGNLVNDRTASYINSIFWGGLTFGRLISIPLARKIKPEKYLLGNFGLAVASLALIIIWPRNEAIVWIVSGGFGLSLSSIFPTLVSLGEKRIKVTGRVMSFFLMGGSVGVLIMPALLGQIFDYFGSYYVMVTLFAATCLGMIVLLSFLFVSNREDQKYRIDVK